MFSSITCSLHFTSLLSSNELFHLGRFISRPWRVASYLRRIQRTDQEVRNMSSTFSTSERACVSVVCVRSYFYLLVCPVYVDIKLQFSVGLSVEYFVRKWASYPANKILLKAAVIFLCSYYIGLFSFLFTVLYCLCRFRILSAAAATV